MVAAFQNGIREFVGFFDGEVAQAFQRLFPVPGALRPQLLPNSEQPVDSPELLLPPGGLLIKKRHSVLPTQTTGRLTKF